MIEAVIHVIDVMAIVMDIVIGLKCNTCDRRDGDGDGSNGHCYRIEAVMHVIDVMALMIYIVMD